MHQLGQTIRARRKARALTLEQLAQRAGCTKGHLSIIETGKRAPSPPLLQRIEHALGITDGALQRATLWQSTPEPVRQQVAELHRENRSARALARHLRSADLDQLYAAGDLRALVEQIDNLQTHTIDTTPQTAEHPPDHTQHTAETPPHPRPDTPRGHAPGIHAVCAAVPIVNSVQAGYPREFTDLGYPARVADDYVSVPGVTDPDAFAARVVGDSMEPEYREGDIVIFSPLVDAGEGTDCFVRLERDDETTFKRVFVEERAGGGGVAAPNGAHAGPSVRTDPGGARSVGPDPAGGPGAGGAHGDASSGESVDDGGPPGDGPSGAGEIARRIRLQPLNPRYAPRVVDREEIGWMYRAVCVIRRIRGGGGVP